MKREREREDGAERQRDERKEGQNKKKKKRREGCWTGPESEHILSVCEPSGV